MSDTPDAPHPLPTRPPTPDETGWQSWRRSDEQETPKRLEEAAKFCTGLYGITYAILLGHDGDEALKQSHEVGLKWVAGLWLLSLVAAFVVVFPLRRAYRSDSAASIAAMHGRVVRFKYRLLAASAGLWLLALGALTRLYFLG